MFEVLPARDPAEDHRLGNPPLLRPHREVHVGDDQADERHAGHAVQHIGEAPGAVAEEIGVAGEERRPHADHHEQAVTATTESPAATIARW